MGTVIELFPERRGMRVMPPDMLDFLLAIFREQRAHRAAYIKRCEEFEKQFGRAATFTPSP